MLFRVVVLETIVAIDVASPFRKQIADNRPEPAGVEKGVKVRKSPTSNSPYPIQGFVLSSLHGSLQNAPNVWDESVFRSSMD
jgi:hypothetical protein